MKSRVTLLSCTALLLSFSSLSAAHAVTSDEQIRNWYLGGSGDLTWLRHSDTGGGANIDFGYRVGTVDKGDLRIEAEVGYHRAGGDDGYSSTHYLTYMGNVYYDFNNLLAYNRADLSISPYIGGGLGHAEIHYGNSDLANTFHHHDSSFAWQGMAGLNFANAAMPNVTWSLGYRYLGTEEPTLHANSAELGVKFNF